MKTSAGLHPQVLQTLLAWRPHSEASLGHVTEGGGVEVRAFCGGLAPKTERRAEQFGKLLPRFPSISCVDKVEAQSSHRKKTLGIRKKVDSTDIPTFQTYICVSTLWFCILAGLEPSFGNSKIPYLAPPGINLVWRRLSIVLQKSLPGRLPCSARVETCNSVTLQVPMALTLVRNESLAPRRPTESRICILIHRPQQLDRAEL